MKGEASTIQRTAATAHSEACGRGLSVDIDRPAVDGHVGWVLDPRGSCIAEYDANDVLLRRHERTGRPLGESAFLDRIEQALGRPVRPRKRGRKPKRREK